MPVNTTHAEYDRMSSNWASCRDVTTGQDAVHAAAERYLPKLKDQTPDDYKAYVGRATFYNATWRTVAGLVGMLLRQPPKVEVPPAMEAQLEDVTLSGVPLQNFAQQTCEEALKLGRLGLLVDYPTVDVTNTTLADAKRLNLRPMMQLYRAENILNWHTARVNNVVVLTMVVLREEAELPVDEYAVKCEPRFRVLTLEEGKYRVRVFKLDAAGKEELLSEVFPLMHGKSLDYIPFTFLSCDDNTPEVDEPPLIDLVNVNLSHYRSTADLEHGAHFTGLPTAVITGYTPENAGEKLYIGSTAAWVFPKADATATFLEFKGEGLGTLMKLLDSKEKQMAILGARMLEPQKKGVESSDTVSIHRKGEESMLAAAAQSISLGMTRALKWFADWGGLDSSKVVFELNRDFYPAPMDSLMLTALVSSWQQGAFSDQVLFDNLKQGEVIAEETTFEQEQARLQSQAPKLQGQPGPGEPPPKLPPGKDDKAKPRKTTITGPAGQKYVVEHS